MREILFLRQPNERLALWEGHKLSEDEARRLSGVQTVKWLSDFPSIFHQLMCECDRVYLNSNEHKRAVIEVETRDARFIADCQRRYPLHQYERLAPILSRLRLIKDKEEIALIQRACDITEAGFRRVLSFVQPGVNEADVEAEYIHEFTRNHARFAYEPIIASGRNSCVLHYGQNNQTCKTGDVLLLDVAASYRNYKSDLTRTIPVSGRFTQRQRDVYNAVLRAFRAICAELVPGVLLRDVQKKAEAHVEKELLRLKLLKRSDIEKQDPKSPALKKFFMHGFGHSIGLDTHDVGAASERVKPGWVVTVEPGIYIPDENFGVRIENDILVTKKGVVDLMASIPIEPEEIEELMSKAGRSRRGKRVK